MHSLLERYLEDVASRLGPLPEVRRNEELREMRQHLLNAVIVNQGLGQSQEEATQNIIEQFGKPEELGTKIAWAWRREWRAYWFSFWGAAALALILTFRPNLAGWMVHLTEPYLSRLPHGWEGELGRVLLLLPAYLLCGLFCGLAFPKRAVAGTAIAEAGLITLFVTSNLSYLAQEFIGDKLLASLLLLEWSFCPLAAVLGAWAGSRCRGRRMSHAQPA